MSNKELGRDPETIISASVKVEGDFVSQGNVLIEGGVEGSLKTSKDLRVGENAQISADVAAANANVSGEIRGNITISERLELEPSARIYGDIKTKDLVILSGATVNGRITMGEDKVEDKTAKATMKTEATTEKGKIVKATEKDAVEEDKEKKTVNAFFTR